LNLLALDTATEACSAAILSNGEILQLYELAPRRHAELILKMIDDLIKESGIQLDQFDALAYGRGPGAFTGLRIAAGVAQGLAFGAELPVIPVSTLAALAQGVEQDCDYIFSAIDARMGEIYWAVFRKGENGLVYAITEEAVADPVSVEVNDTGRYIGTGSAWSNYNEILSKNIAGQLQGFEAETYPQARDILRLAEQDYLNGNTVSPDDALPVYLRNSVTG
jgi:tRNA threonylcarbamoyladenosine biosynthesis protein TsaB